LLTAQQVFDQPQPQWIVQAPGRDMWIAAMPTDSTEYRVDAVDLDTSAKFSHRSAKTRQTVLKRPLPGWVRYPAGVVSTLGDDGLSIPSFHALVLGDEPSGPRYDFGMGMVFAAFCHHLAGAAATEEALVEVVERVRRDYVGA